MITGQTIDGEFAFNLFQTFGYPKEMTEEIALEKKIGLSENFNDEFEAAYEKSSGSFENRQCRKV